MLAVPPPLIEATKMAGPACGDSSAAAGASAVTTLLGAVISEQARMMADAVMAEARRSVRRIMGDSPDRWRGQSVGARLDSLLQGTGDKLETPAQKPLKGRS